MRNLMRCFVFSMALAAGACSNSSTSDYDDKEGYEQSTSSRDTFMGYNCTDDCSGHEAGYEWAEENGITDPNECGGNSWSFEEGCQAYAEEQSSAYGYDDYDYNEGY